MNENVKTGPGGWANIEIAVQNGPITKRAYMLEPFAVHQHSGSGYRVTHLRTGMATPLRFTEFEAAKQASSWLRKAVADQDLNVDTEDVEHVIAELKQVFPAIHQRCHDTFNTQVLYTGGNQDLYTGNSALED